MSDSPYLSVFNGLERVHRKIKRETLEKVMLDIEYRTIKEYECDLPNEKKLLQIDFEK